MENYTFTPCAMFIPPHVIMMAAIDNLKLNISQQTKNIFDGMRDELDQHSVGGYSYQATMVI